VYHSIFPGCYLEDLRAKWSSRAYTRQEFGIDSLDTTAIVAMDINTGKNTDNIKDLVLYGDFYAGIQKPYGTEHEAMASGLSWALQLLFTAGLRAGKRFC